jgi:NADH-quinone oxidoreductase subunit L
VEDLIWLIPALPLLGFVLLLVGGRKLGEPLAGWLAAAMVGGSFAATVALYLDLVNNDGEARELTQTLFTWVPSGSFEVGVGLLADPLSITMALFITGVGTLIHVYAIGYMHGDEKFSKFFLYMNLFVFSMLILVLSDNLLLTFLGWEGVGACSYFLIAFWFTLDSNATAGKKAFVTNRIGDWGFMLAMFVAFASYGTVEYLELNGLARGGQMAAVTATAIAGLLFIAAIGKSAQIPLFVWLPDAMAGPTPVSALIHAATMVTAGVYLLVRVNGVLDAAYDWLPTTIAWLGAITAFVAATVAVAQNDIKKVLAYSTVSQLGYMFLAVGSGAFVAAIFHMVTHAFFKALLFLASGSVIHGMNEQQDMRGMGGLRKYAPITTAVFIIGWLAIAGVPPLAGFWSKDEALLFAFNKSPALWVVGFLTAVLTAFYMTRQVVMTFFGTPDWQKDEPEMESVLLAESEARGDEPVEAVFFDGKGHRHHLPDKDFEPHDPTWTMWLPLAVLAVFAVFGGMIQLPFTSDLKSLEHWLEPVVEGAEVHVDLATGVKWILALVAVVGGLAGIAAGWMMYGRGKGDRSAVERPFLARAWRIDDTYAAFVAGPGTAGFEATAAFDQTVIDGAVNGIAGGTRRLSGVLRRQQNGLVRSYALSIGLGALVLLGWVLTRVTW